MVTGDLATQGAYHVSRPEIKRIEKKSVLADDRDVVSVNRLVRAIPEICVTSASAVPNLGTG
jgi:hypothetical protein